MGKIVQWSIEKLKQLVDLAKDIRRPMTFYVLATGASFWSLWELMPDEGSTAISIGAAIFGGLFAAIIITCCVLVYLVAKERLKVDPHYLSKPATHE